MRLIIILTLFSLMSCVPEQTTEFNKLVSAPGKVAPIFVPEPIAKKVDVPAPVPVPKVDPDKIDQDDKVGLIGGHFDLDTSTELYDFDHGSTNHHEHEYDNNHDTTEADFFNLRNNRFDQIDEVVKGEKFILIVANSELSTGAVLEINGLKIGVVEYQKKVAAFFSGDKSALDIYSITELADSKKLLSLKVGFDKDVIAKGGLVPTQTGCVKKNKAGKNGEYRNGALTFQAISVDSEYSLDQATKVASFKSLLLWEATIFWHWDGECY